MRASNAVPQLSRRPRRLTVGMIGTYPPTRCGIATFTASLSRAMVRTGRVGNVRVARSVEIESQAPLPAGVVAEVVRGSSRSRVAAAAHLEECDAVVVQHEFGIYGGRDGTELLDLVQELDRPVIVVLHTVLSAPTTTQRDILEQLSDRAEALVVQSAAAGERLLAAHDIDPRIIHRIPHGATPNLSASPALARPGEVAPLVLTWGLLGPGKGIEDGITAMALLDDLVPAPRYLVVGQTHPKVRERDGESYRASLEQRARDLGVGDRVRFDDSYHDARRILERVREADLVLLPYRSREQVVSGVLVEAIASSTPVVATAFPHACELLTHGAGIVVPHEDPAAIAGAIRDLCSDNGRAAAVIAAARRAAPALSWDAVARSYCDLAAAAVARPLEVAV